MCRTVHAVLQTAICGIQMLVRVFMTVILMIENLIRMILQTLYNFISFMLQMISLIPICVVFMLTARLKCFMCGGGGPCPVNRGGTCDCIMSLFAIIILFFIFRATGVLDKIFYSIGYIKHRSVALRFIPTPGDITACSRNETDYEEETVTAERTTGEVMYRFTDVYTIPISTTETTYYTTDARDNVEGMFGGDSTTESHTVERNNIEDLPNWIRAFARDRDSNNIKNWTTVLPMFL